MNRPAAAELTRFAAREVAEELAGRDRGFLAELVSATGEILDDGATEPPDARYVVARVLANLTDQAAAGGGLIETSLARAVMVLHDALVAELEESADRRLRLVERPSASRGGLRAPGPVQRPTGPPRRSVIAQA